MAAEKSRPIRPGMYRVRLDPTQDPVLAEVKPGVHPLVSVRPKEGRLRGVWLSVTLATISIAAA